MEAEKALAATLDKQNALPSKKRLNKSESRYKIPKGPIKAN